MDCPADLSSIIAELTLDQFCFAPSDVFPSLALHWQRFGMEHYWRFSVIVVVILLLFKQCVFLPLKYLFQRTRLHLQRMAAFICNRTLPIAAATVAADAPPAAAKVSDDADEDDVRNIPIVPTVNVAQFLDDGAKQLVTFRQGISQRIATYDKLNAVLHKHFQLVGADTLVYILSFLDGPSVSAFQGVNRFCRHIGVRGQVWLRLCHCELKLNGIESKSTASEIDHITWASVYIARRRQKLQAALHTQQREQEVQESKQLDFQYGNGIKDVMFTMRYFSTFLHSAPLMMLLWQYRGPALTWLMTAIAFALRFCVCFFFSRVYGAGYRLRAILLVFAIWSTVEILAGWPNFPFTVDFQQSTLHWQVWMTPLPFAMAVFPAWGIFPNIHPLLILGLIGSHGFTAGAWTLWPSLWALVPSFSVFSVNISGIAWAVFVSPLRAGSFLWSAMGWLFGAYWWLWDIGCRFLWFSPTIMSFTYQLVVLSASALLLLYWHLVVLELATSVFDCFDLLKRAPAFVPSFTVLQVSLLALGNAFVLQFFTSIGWMSPELLYNWWMTWVPMVFPYAMRISALAVATETASMQIQQLVPPPPLFLSEPTWSWPVLFDPLSKARQLLRLTLAVALPILVDEYTLAYLELSTPWLSPFLWLAQLQRLFVLFSVEGSFAFKILVHSIVPCLWMPSVLFAALLTLVLCVVHFKMYIIPRYLWLVWQRPGVQLTTTSVFRIYAPLYPFLAATLCFLCAGAWYYYNLPNVNEAAYLPSVIGVTASVIWLVVWLCTY